MYLHDDVMSVRFDNSAEAIDVHPDDLIDAVVGFLEHYATPYLVGNVFCEVVGSGDGRQKLDQLLRRTGYDNRPAEFVRYLVRWLEKADSSRYEPLKLKEVELPYLLLTAVLEKLIPGNRYISVTRVAQLEELTNTVIPEDQHADLKKVIDTYPVRLSMHTVRQMRLSKDVAYQYLPFVEELDPVGHTNTWIGQFHQGLLEQMYQNRVIFLLNMSCPVYCRFCFRKHKESRNQSNPTTEDVRKAVAHVKNTPTIKEIVITGGDPFLNRDNMACAIDGLMKIDHVQTLRLATRSVAYYPHLFLGKDGGLLKYLKMKNLELQLAGKRMEVATHFIHPDEISLDSLKIISELVQNGIAVYVQTPFLKDCNDKGPELTRLFHLLRGAGAELHYIYIPCSPIHGNRIYWSPLFSGINVAKYLRAHLSDRVIPRICTATPIGKMDWFTSGWAVKPDENDDHFLWIRTPYTPDYFKSFAPLSEQIDNIKVNDEGTIDIRYMAEIGDTNLFIGSRAKPDATEKSRSTFAPSAGENVIADQNILPGIINTGLSHLSRTHKTRVEIDADAGSEEIEYIRSNSDITDVIIASETDIVDRFYDVERLIQALWDVSHVNAVRLRSCFFNQRPDKYTPALIDRIGFLNRLNIASPQRLEVETRFIYADEIQPVHRKLVRELLNRGITVYNNTPLLGGINDTPDAINTLAYTLREIGIEFHHLYVAGLPEQEKWNIQKPVDVSDVIDICSRVRREGSGREIPRYIILTRLGEVDFGLTSTLLKQNGHLKLKLRPYSLSYFQDMDPSFRWPENVETSTDGIPIVTINGLTDTGGFMVFEE